MEIALAPWTAPPGHRVDHSRRRLSLQRPRPLPTSAPRGQDARDLLAFDQLLTHPGYGATPMAILQAFRQAEQGNPQLQCDMFTDFIEGDCNLRSLFEKREQATAGKPAVLQAGGPKPDDELAAHVLRTALARLPMVEAFEHLLTFNRFGWSGAEIDWGLMPLEGRTWIVPTWFTPVPARRFRIATVNGLTSTGLDELRLYTNYVRPLGDELRPGKWWCVRRSGAFLACAGLMRSGCWPALGKRYGYRDWMIWSEKFGQPIPLATYDETADDEAKEIATDIIASIGNTSGAIKPKSIEVEFAEVDRTAGNSTHSELIEYANAEESKLVNGSTLANDNKGSGGASYALGSVHDGVRWEAVQYDAERIQTSFRLCVSAAFVQFNSLACAPPELRIQVVRDLDPTTRTNVAVKLKNELGVDVSTSQLRQELGFREPSGDADKAPGMQVQSFPAPAGGTPP